MTKRLSPIPLPLALALLTLCVAAIAGCTSPIEAPQNAQSAPSQSTAKAAPVQTVEPANAPPKLISPPVTPADGPVADGDWVVRCLHAEPQHLNPLLDTSDAYCAEISGYIFESLLERDDTTLKLKPLLAKSYTVSPDHLTYTFKLRKDAKFSDGQPVTAADVVFTMNTIMNPKNETVTLRSYYQDVIKTEALDKYTVRFVCRKPYFKNLEMLGGLPIYPKHIYGTGDFNTSPYNRKPVGSGPFVFESWTTNQEITLARNENYWNPAKKPHIKKLVYKIILDENAAMQVLQQRQLDDMTLTAEQWMNEGDSPQIRKNFVRFEHWGAGGSLGSYGYIGWNLRRPQFRDKRVRRALTMLLNRKEILATIFYGIGQVISGPESPNSPDYNPNVKPLPFDPAAAKKLLDEAGWVDTNGDGIRDKNGVPFRFQFLYPTGSNSIDRLSTVYKQQLKKAGIDMTIRPLEWATFVEDLTKRSFDAVCLGWTVDVDSDPYQVWHSSQAAHGSNAVGYKNPAMDKLMEDARVEFNAKKRRQMYWHFFKVIHDDQPYTFLFSRPTLEVLDKRFRNVKVYPLGTDEREWWVPKNLQRYN